MKKSPANAVSQAAGLLARKEVVLFLILAFGLSCIFYYLVATATTKSNLLIFTVALMWCPAVAAIITRLYYQHNLNGFGLGWGESKWQLVGIFLPIFLGLVMFGFVWLTGIAQFNPEKAAQMFSLSFLPAFAMSLVFNLFAGFGEELGWRGLLVPEMSKFMSFTKLALLSGAIWAVWHFPEIIFGTYHGTGSLLFSLLVFTPQVIASGVILAWLRLKSGSVWVAVFFHGIWNLFIQTIYPALTVQTPASQLVTGEFGWLSPLMLVVVAFVFWHYRDRLPKPQAATA
jgi:membrane protease YdiL (CAAX protease family)